MNLVMELISAPVGAAWSVLTSWLFWLIAAPASLAMLAVMYRRQLGMVTQGLIVNAGDVARHVLAVAGSLWIAGSDALRRVRRKSR